MTNHQTVFCTDSRIQLTAAYMAVIQEKKKNGGNCYSAAVQQLPPFFFFLQNNLCIRILGLGPFFMYCLLFLRTIIISFVHLRGNPTCKLLKKHAFTPAHDQPVKRNPSIDIPCSLDFLLYIHSTAFQLRAALSRRQVSSALPVPSRHLCRLHLDRILICNDREREPCLSPTSSHRSPKVVPVLSSPFTACVQTYSLRALQKYFAGL